MIQTIFRLSRKQYIIIGCVIALVGVILFVTFSRRAVEVNDYAVVRRSDIRGEVSVTGRVEAQSSASLAFERGGVVARVYSNVGDRVLEGDRIAELASGDLQAQLKEAEANYDVAQAELDALRRGARVEDIQIFESIVRRAEQDLTNEFNGAPVVFTDAFVKADDAVRRQTDALFENDDGLTPVLAFRTSNDQARVDAEFSRLIVGNELRTWSEEIHHAFSDSSSTKLALARVQGRLQRIQDFLNSAKDALQSAFNVPQTTLELYQASVASARTSVSTALSQVTAKIASISAYESSLAKAKSDLLFKQAGASLEDIRIQEARVRAAHARLDAVRAELQKTIIRAPFAGVITRQDARVGETIAPQVTLISLLSDKLFKIEANVAEADIARVVVGQKARVTFDAFRRSYEERARVTSIDPGAVMLAGVPTYKVTFMFDNLHADIKSGMTANIDIMTEEKNNVLVIPQRAMRIAGSSYVVMVLDSSGVGSERVVVPGARGVDGMVEIVDGLSEGERVATSFR